uniref:Uncharacterized protein n=1 Tax=Arundo donax TaxID=35708 RepID=A0A0A8ZMM9_ARUDO
MLLGTDQATQHNEADLRSERRDGSIPHAIAQPQRSDRRPPIRVNRERR